MFKQRWQRQRHWQRQWQRQRQCCRRLSLASAIKTCLKLYASTCVAAAVGVDCAATARVEVEVRAAVSQAWACTKCIAHIVQGCSTCGHTHTHTCIHTNIFVPYFGVIPIYALVFIVVVAATAGFHFFFLLSNFVFDFHFKALFSLRCKR